MRVYHYIDIYHHIEHLSPYWTEMCVHHYIDINHFIGRKCVFIIALTYITLLDEIVCLSLHWHQSLYWTVICVYYCIDINHFIGQKCVLIITLISIPLLDWYVWICRNLMLLFLWFSNVWKSTSSCCSLVCLLFVDY